MNDMEPAAVALFDQGYAASEEILGHLIDSYRTVRAEAAAEGDPGAVAIWALAKHIAEQWDTTATSSALAVAVVVLDSYMTNCEHNGDD